MASAVLALAFIAPGCGSGGATTAARSTPASERSFTPDEVESVLRAQGLHLHETVVPGLAIFVGRKGDAFVRLHVFFGTSGMKRARREAAVIVPSSLRHGWPAGRIGNVVYDVTPTRRPLVVPVAVLEAIHRLRG
jgi:hypothetical protein